MIIKRKIRNFGSTKCCPYYYGSFFNHIAHLGIPIYVSELLFWKVPVPHQQMSHLMTYEQCVAKHDLEDFLIFCKCNLQ